MKLKTVLFPFAIAARALFAIVLLVGFLRKRLTLAGILKAAALLPVSALAAVALTFPGHRSAQVGHSTIEPVVTELRGL